MTLKVYARLCAGLLGISSAGIVSADVVDEYTSLAGWSADVTDESAYTFSGASGTVSPFPSSGANFGPGTFTTPGNVTLLFNDGLYGSGAEYIAAVPGLFEGSDPASVVVSFNASADVTALAFTLGSGGVGSDIAIAVNGATLAPLTVSTASPTAFLGVTDNSGPITNITFTDSHFQNPGNLGNLQELDVIKSYDTAHAVVSAPEIAPGSAAGGVALLFGGIAVLRGGKRRRASDGS